MNRDSGSFLGAAWEPASCDNPNRFRSGGCDHLGVKNTLMQTDRGERSEVVGALGLEVEAWHPRDLAPFSAEMPPLP